MCIRRFARCICAGSALQRQAAAGEEPDDDRPLTKEADMLRFTTLAAIAIAAAQPALAAPPMEYGTGDGERFAYTTELRADGVIHIAGFMVASGDPFSLDVRPNGHVDGHFGNAPVEYDVSKKVRDGVAEQLGEARAFAQASN